jgi:hypothetical protein
MRHLPVTTADYGPPTADKQITTTTDHGPPTAAKTLTTADH